MGQGATEQLKEPDARPLVSVVVPCLNRAQFLRQTIDSILMQDYPKIECIVVDGGSTDATLEILRSYEDRIQWISETDEGHADAINKGWRMSKGTVLAWLNADDIYVVPSAVPSAVAFLMAHPDVDTVYGDYVEIDATGKMILNWLRPDDWSLFRAVGYCDHVIPQASSFMRRAILEEVGWLDPSFRYCKDHELWLRIGLTGVIQYAPLLVAGVRVTPGISQHLETSWAKVRLTERFFRLSNLPSSFLSPRFQRRALSNAYLAGAYFALGGGHHAATFSFLARSALRDPSNLPYISFRVVQHLAGLLVPVSFRKMGKRLLIRSGIMRKVLALPGQGS